ncbi:MarR family winged helix-turn-helix transcriptional regulator [Bradyrhizobium sp. AUGA SZCCT0431]|uniref:MarR family winged helix-turn-helix transcriptional regulator n=1 Tax=Bradyrhizobium sp. AUGA SZCCT0431 TaxID=2807674 RepID=UPI001BA5A20B|nr:MarR family transcriptional regulator [Bradyrhizobium sp. AUGA SZCCT0431]MBR1146291.1 MarR family transcriptional regulator [Bradyrhizobium sp. AUGA SZCCT0431]
MHELLANKLAALSIAIDDRTDAGARRSRSAAAALQTLRHWGALTATELARILGVSQPTMVRVVDGLIRERLVIRRGKQARRVELELTRAGRSEAARLRRARLADVSNLLRALDVEQARSFEESVDLLLAAITDGRPTARRICRFCAHDICDGPACPVGSRATTLEGELKEKPRGDIGA